jgi:hypothetical protein
MTSFPLEARVILHGLVKAPDLNGRTGIIKSEVTDGRQQVHLEDLNKNVALKVDNLKYEGREIATLSVKELKLLLKLKNVEDTELVGADKTELKTKLKDMAISSEEIAQILAIAKAPKPTAPAAAAATNTTFNGQASQAADQLSSMSPEQMRQQAQMMRSMDPDHIRRTNPQLAHMSNDQLQQAATQMEMMANNPEMMKTAADQMKNMSPQELQRMQATGGAGAVAPAAGASPNAQQGANMMANMTPEQLRKQAEMMKSMPPDQIRRMNPQLAHMSDAQIQMAANQFQMMADNPDMMKMAMDQMKNMSPDEVAKMQQQAGNNPENPPDLANMGDPAKMLESMDPKQLKQMMTTLKQNPEMLKQFATMSGMPEAQLTQGLEMFAGLSDDKMESALKMMQKAQKAKDMWSKANSKTGGHLLKIVIVVGITLVYLVIQRFWFGGAVAAATVATPLAQQAVPEAIPVMADEFEGEF